MGKKYIIELLDDCPSEFKGIMVFGLTQEKQISVELIPEESMTPYTEPDLEQVRKEAYEKGYETAKHECEDCNANAVKIADDNAHEAYQKGLEDAWDAARKICDMKWTKRSEVFGIDVYADIIALPASECIEKICQYEQEKEEQIQVGDEVENTQTGVRFIVTHMWVNNHGEKGVSGFNRDCSAFSTTIELIRKTGRHFPEIAEVLQKMKES